MKTRVLSRIFALTLIATMLSSSITFAKDSNINTSNKDTELTVKTINSSVSDRELAINNLLNNGWTMSEIKDLLSDSEIMDHRNYTPIKSMTKYLKLVCQTREVESYDNKTKTKIKKKELVEGTEKFIELSKEQCEYEVEKNKAEKNKDNGYVDLSETVSNAGVLNLTPLVSESQPSQSNDGYLKYTIAANSASSTHIGISYRYEWLQDPYYTNVDVIGLGHDTGLVRDPAAGDTFVYKYTYYYDGWGTSTTIDTPIDKNADTGGVVYSFDLQDKNTANNFGHVSWYGSHRGYIAYQCCPQSSITKNVYIYGQYKHHERSISVEPSISWPLGASLSVSYSSQYVSELPNAELMFQVN